MRAHLRVVAELGPRQLAELLVAVVHDGASVGFLPPLPVDQVERYWSGLLAAGVVLLIAETDGRIIGTVQLHLASQPNARHRAEVAKLMVHPAARRQGIGRQLMHEVEAEARRRGRSLLVLDTRAGDPSNELYTSVGFQEAGRIPRYARSGNGQLDAAVFYYKELT